MKTLSSETGRELVREWLKGLDKSDKKRIGVDIEKVRLLWPVGMSTRNGIHNVAII